MTKQANICFDCQRACGDCSWSEYDLDRGVALLKPVEGWTAELVKYQHLGYTYSVTACPLFIPDEPRSVKIKNFKKCCLCGNEIDVHSNRRKYCEKCVPDGWYYNEQQKKLVRRTHKRGGEEV